VADDSMACDKLPVIDYHAGDQRRRPVSRSRRAILFTGRALGVAVVLVGVLAIWVSLAPHPDWDWSLGAMIIGVGVAVFVASHYLGR
jgi:hypothetical protein